MAVQGCSKKKVATNEGTAPFCPQSDATGVSEAPGQRNDGAIADGRPPDYKRIAPRFGND